MLNRIGYFLLASLIVGAMIVIALKLGEWKNGSGSQTTSLKKEVVKAKKELSSSQAQVLVAKQEVQTAKKKATKKQDLFVVARQEVRRSITDSTGIKALDKYDAAIDSTLAAKVDVISAQDTVIAKQDSVLTTAGKVIDKQDKVIEEQDKNKKRNKLLIGGAVGATIVVIIIALM